MLRARASVVARVLTARGEGVGLAGILWQVFVHYANLGSVGVSTVLTMNNLRRMLRDARVSDAKFTSYQVDAVLAQSKGVLDFGGLQAVLMELAKRKFPAVSNPQDAYQQLLRDHVRARARVWSLALLPSRVTCAHVQVLPYCSRLEGDNMQQTMREPAIVEVFARYEVRTSGAPAMSERSRAPVLMRRCVQRCAASLRSTRARRTARTARGRTSTRRCTACRTASSACSHSTLSSCPTSSRGSRRPRYGSSCGALLAWGAR